MKQPNKEVNYIINSLVSLGMCKNAAKALTYLQILDSTECFELSRRTGLRQPEISLALKSLRQHGWLLEEKVKKGGRGRPFTVYSLTVSFGDVLDQLEKEQHQKTVDELKSKLNHLKELRFNSIH